MNLENLKRGDLVVIPIVKDGNRYSPLGFRYSNTIINYWVFVIAYNNKSNSTVEVYSLYGLPSFDSGTTSSHGNAEYVYDKISYKDLLSINNFNVCKKCRNLCQQHCPNYNLVHSEPKIVKNYYLNHKV